MKKKRIPVYLPFPVCRRRKAPVPKTAQALTLAANHFHEKENQISAYGKMTALQALMRAPSGS